MSSLQCALWEYRSVIYIVTANISDCDLLKSLLKWKKKWLIVRFIFFIQTRFVIVPLFWIFCTTWCYLWVINCSSSKRRTNCIPKLLFSTPRFPLLIFRSSISLLFRSNNYTYILRSSWKKQWWYI